MHQYHETSRSMGANLLASLLVAFLGFFVVAAILMSVWNYTIPRLAHSVVNSYTYGGLPVTSIKDEGARPPAIPENGAVNEEDADWSNIDYPTAMVFLILLSMLFAPFAIFREWRADRLLRTMDYEQDVPLTHVGSGATLETMKAKRASARRSLGRVE